MKSSQIFTKVAQIGTKEVFYAKRYVLKIAQKVAQYLSLFCKRICLQDFSKVAQAGHTGHSNSMAIINGSGVLME